MRLLALFSALVVCALASPEALAASCGQMGGGIEPSMAVQSFSDGQRASCCPAGAGCGVCCLTPSPVAPEPLAVGVSANVAAVVFASVVLGSPPVVRLRHEASVEGGLLRAPERPGTSGPRGPPVG